MSRIGSAKLVCRLELQATTLIACDLLELQKQLLREEELTRALVKNRRGCYGYKERVAAKHLRVVEVATESNPAEMLTKALGRTKVEEFCAEIGQTETSCEDGGQETQGSQEAQECQVCS